MGGKKEPLKYLIPHLKHKMQNRETWAEKPVGTDFSTDISSFF